MSGSNKFKRGKKINSIPIDDYLHRIGLRKAACSIEFLKAIHKAHLIHIPFENLDIYFNKKLLLDIDEIFKKVILSNRGGTSFELNILIFHLLHGLGFQCLLISARKRAGNSWGPGFDYPLVIVNIHDDQWLMDVGNTSNFIEPIKLQLNLVQLDYNQYFRAISDPDQNYILQRSDNGNDFESIYLFNISSKEIIEFLDRFNYYQESEESPLKQAKLISKYTSEGKIILSDQELIILDKGEVKRYPILQEDDFASKLQMHFGIDYDHLFRQRLGQ